MAETLLTRINRSFKAAVSAWQTDSLDIANWNELDNRQTRYYLYEKLYTNDFFTTSNRHLESIKQTYSLYRHIRGIHNPVERLIEGYVAAVYGDSVDLVELKTGSIPIVTEDEKEREAIKQLFINTNIEQFKSLYVRKSANLGDCFLKVIEHNNTTKIEIIDPRLVNVMEIGQGGELVYVELFGEFTNDEDQSSEYKEIITEEEFRIFVDDELVESYPNEYGFIPIVHVKFRDIGLLWGQNAYHAQLAKILELNDAASLLNNNIRNTVEQLYGASGIAKGRLETNRDEPNRDMLRVVYLPANAELKAVGSELDIEGALANIKHMKDELDSDLPVLALHNLRLQANISSVAIRAAYSDAIKRIKEVQTNLDAGLRTAIIMAVAIDGFRNRNEFNLDFYTENQATFYIAIREVINDGLTKEQEIRFMTENNADGVLTESILVRLGFSPEEIRNIKLERKRIEQRNLQATIASNSRFNRREEDNDDSDNRNSRFGRENNQQSQQGADQTN